MRSSQPVVRRRLQGVIVALVLGTVGVACGDDGDAADTSVSASTSTTPAVEPSSTLASSTTVPMGQNLESLSYLIQGLLTTEQIGSGWVDQGRKVIPPGSNQMTGFLCSEGDAMVTKLEGRADPQVSTSFRRAGDVGLTVFESLMWGDRDQVVADFNAVADGVKVCDGETYSTADLGEITLTVDSAPDYGSSSIAYTFGPVTQPTSNPWLEQSVTAVLLDDPEQPVALVIAVGATTVHDPANAKTTTLEAAEYQRIVKAAIDRIKDGL